MKIKIADLTVEIKNRFPFVERLCEGYLTEGEADITVSATDPEIERERAESEMDFSDGYLESIVVYRKIAEQLPRFDAFVFHGAVISFDGKGIVFTARSGTGKTTHTRLIMKRYPDRAFYVNGDKPIIRFKDGSPYAYGTPWNGKERYGTNSSVPLCGIAIVNRADTNYTVPREVDEISNMLVTQTYIPKANGLMAVRGLSLCNNLIESIPTVDLYCNMEDEAADATLTAFGLI